MDFKTRKGVKTLGSIIIGLIIVAGYFVVIQPFLSQNAQYAEEVTAAESNMDTVQNKLVQLRKQKENITAIEKNDDALGEEFPNFVDMPAIRSMILTSASSAGISTKDVTNIEVGIPTPSVAQADAATGNSATPAPNSSETTTDKAAPAPNSEASSDMAQSEISITVSSSPEKGTQFLKNLQNSKRNFVVSSVVYSSDEGGKMTVKATTYIHRVTGKVGDKSATPQQAPQTPATPTPAPSN